MVVIGFVFVAFSFKSGGVSATNGGTNLKEALSWEQR
jgi:hypothetical protein